MQPSLSKSGLFFRFLFFSVNLTFCFALSVPGQAQVAKTYVPENLAPWVPWILEDDQVDLCPFLSGKEGEGICSWGSVLQLSLEDASASFEQRFRLFDEEWVPLPGDDDHWPQEVKKNGEAVAVVLLGGFPHVSLPPGEHTLTGRFFWDSLPKSFQVPPQTGLLSLSVRGARLPFPKRDDGGRLWLEEEEALVGGEEYVETRIHRHLLDEIPFVMTTHIGLDVSGKTREIMIPKAVLPEFSPLSLQSELPARLEKDGALRVQVRAGSWPIHLASRFKGPVGELTLAPSGGGEGDAEEEEIWVFEAKNDLRIVSIEGVSTVDPQQTTLPEEWKRLPAYKMRPTDVMKFVERQRGDSNPSPDQLSLTRDLWLDFDGGGYTVSDRVGGTMNRSWRLEMNPPFALGRLSVAGEDQFITKLPGEDRTGVEIREGSIDVTADSRLSLRGQGIPAVGWNHDFQSVAATLHLPPGWRIFSAIGADHVPETWINRWNLLEIFLVLILALSFAKLWGMRWGFISLVALGLTFPEGGAPMWIWLPLLVGVALMRVIRKGWILSFLKVYRVGVLVLLVIFAIPFMVEQARMALYPTLEHPWQRITGEAPVLGEGVPDRMEKKAVVREEMGPAAPPSVNQQPISKYQESFQKLYRLKQVPGAKVQTGPGLPRWSWREVAISWSGPVEKEQKLRFFLIPPWLNFILSFARILLLALLVFCVFEFPEKFWPPFFRKCLSPILFLLAVMLVPQPAHADFPSTELLNQLKERLIKKPECTPNCAAISRMKLEVSPQILRARLEVGVEGETALPLPGLKKEWEPSQVIVDGAPFAGLYRDDEGRLWVQLPAGAHQIILEGPLPPRPTIQFSLPLKPHYAEATVVGWTLSGLHEDGQVDDNLQLTRTQAVSTSISEEKELSSQVLSPFVRVERYLSLGLTWEMETRVVRLTPPGSAAILEIPLLEGESVTTGGMRVEGGKVRVSFSPQSTEISWRSVLAVREIISLKAADSLAWAELWQLDAAPIWHVQVKGIPFIHREGAGGTWPPVWRPWPGEEVAISVTRPLGVEGQTVTIDHSQLVVKPGRRFTDATLALSLRSSLGGQHIISIPGLDELKSVSINGNVEPVRPVGGKINLPLTPGSQNITLNWQEAEGMGFLFKTPSVDLGLSSVNTETQIELPPDRWILWVCGPRMGPAVLFWGLLIVLLLAAYALGRFRLTPLRFIQWALLGIGLSQAPIWAFVIVASWLMAFGLRKDRPPENKLVFNFVQLALPCFTLIALTVLIYTIYQGLLGVPDMQIEGNGSTATLLRWFDDQSANFISRAVALSLPLFWFRIAMLAWALWIAIALISWLKWGWNCYSSSGLWRPMRTIVKPPNS